MSKLYNITNKVLNANSMAEAEQILFGEDGIVIDSSEYYKNIISNFIQKKEIIIKKEKDQNGDIQLVFDLNNCNDLWNILFIYNYYMHYLDKKIAALEEKINQKAIEKENLTGLITKLKKDNMPYQKEMEERNELVQYANQLRQLRQKYENYKTLSPRNIEVAFKNAQNIDEENLEEYIYKLKEAIICIQRIRDSFSHINNELKIDETVTINNSKGNFEIEIPIKYLDGFNKGRIIAEEEDKIIIRETNELASPLLEALNYDIHKIESFFYNVEPKYLDFILSKINYDVNELYKLSPKIFYYKEATMLFIEIGLDIYSISKLPRRAFVYSKNAIELKNEGIDIMQLDGTAFEYPQDAAKLKVKEINIGKLLKYPRRLEIEELKENLPIMYSEATLKLKTEGIDITKLPLEAFENLEATLKLRAEGVDITKLADTAFMYPEHALKLKAEGIDITKLAAGAIVFPDSAIKLKSAGIDITKLPDGAFSFSYPFATIKLKSAGIDITKLPSEAFTFSEGVLKLKSKGINIMQLPVESLVFSEATLKLNAAGVDITKLPNKCFSLDIKPPNFIYLLNLVNNDYNRLEQFPVEFFTCDYNLLEEMTIRYNSNISKSIFGINNPKIIAILIYASNVLSKFNNNIDTSNIYIQSNLIIENSLIDSFKYKKNIEDNINTTYTQQDFIDQFKLIDDNGNSKNSEEIKQHILIKFRNASQHFRFKPVKDDNGNIVEDKIYIYDENNNGVNNFNLIIDLKEFVNIIREVELNINSQKENKSIENEASGKKL